MIAGKRIVAVGGGKGGVGKSVIACNLAVGFAKSGAKTVLIDADLGSPNLHTLLGVERPEGSLSDFLSNPSVQLPNVLTPTKVPGLKLACGAAPILGVANPEFQKKQRLIREISKLDAEVLVVDIGAGVSYNVIDFFNAADLRLVVVTPQITSMHNAYGFIKSSLHRLLQRSIAGRTGYRELFKGGGWSEEKMDQFLERTANFDPRYLSVFEPLINSYSVLLMGNLLDNRRESNVMWAMRRMVRDFLLIECQVIGGLRRSQRVQLSVNQRLPFMLDRHLDQNGQRIKQALQFLQRVDIGAQKKAHQQAIDSAKFLPKISSENSGGKFPNSSKEEFDEENFAEEILDRRRAETRYPQNKSVMVRIEGNEHKAMLVDLSRSGARVAGVPTIEMGGKIEIRLNTNNDKEFNPNWSWIPAIVRYYDQKTKAAGCQFENSAVAKQAVDAVASKFSHDLTPLPSPVQGSAASGV